MANDRLPDPSDPEAVGRAEFATQFRGFDQLQVRSYLKVVARELQRSKEREIELAREVESLRRRAEEAERAASEFDEATLTARLGEETARVLEVARAAAAEKLRRAEESSAQLLDDAKAEAERILGGAQAAVDAEIDAARARGRELVTEARLVRERVLDDLATRRRTIRTQVEQLRSGRDRLLASHGALREALDEIERELEREMPEARVAAEFTGRRLQHEPPGSAALIEIEIDEARRNGTPIVSDDEIAARVEGEPADWVNTGSVPAVSVDGEAPAAHPDEPTDEIPVLDHFGAGDGIERAEIVLAEVGQRKRDHRDLPREPVPLVEAPDEVETVRVVVDAEPEPEPVAVAEPEPEPVAEPEPEPVAEHEPEPVAEAEPAPVAAAEPEPEAPATPEPEPEHAASEVDDLFARIRESRAETVARAREVLEQHRPAGAVAVADPPTAAAEEPDGGDEAAPADVSPEAQRFAARDAALGDIEALVVRKLKRLLADEQNEIQDLVRRRQGKVDRDDVLGERDHHVGRYVAAIGGELLAAVSAGATFDDPEAHAGDIDLSSLDERLAHELIDPLRQILARGVDEAAGDEDDLLDRVRAAYREVKAQRVDTAARVVSLAAFNLGIVAARPEGGLLRWLVDPATGCSPDCDDNSLADPVVAGEAFPTGAVYPPNHPGCRCLLVPVDR